MQLWRTNALAAFPTLSAELQDNEYGIDQLFFDLLPMWKEAHLSSDNLLLHKIHEFAQWCLDGPDYEIWEVVCHGFYEHLFDEHGIPWNNIIRYLPRTTMEAISTLLKERHSAETISHLEKILGYTLGPPPQSSSDYASTEND